MIVDLPVLTNYFSKIDFIDFALLFGSQASGFVNAMSDVDIAIYTNHKLELYESAIIESDLQKLVKREIDLLELNNLYYIQPRLAFEVVSKSKVIFIANQNSYINFKTNTYLNYIEVKPMLEQFNQAFKKRIQDHITKGAKDA